MLYTCVGMRRSDETLRSFTYDRRRKVAKASTMDIPTSHWFLRQFAHLWNSAHKIDDSEIADVNLNEYVHYYKQDQGIEGYSIVKCQSLQCVYANTNVRQQSAEEVQVPDAIKSKYDLC